MFYNGTTTLLLKWDDVSYLPENYIEIYADYVAPPHSLIFALTRPIIKAGIKTVKLSENESFLINQRVGFLKPSKKINSDFLIYVTQSSSFISIFENKITSTIQPNISTEQIDFIKFFCPPFPEQQAIAQYLDERCGKLDKIIAIKQQQIKTLDALRQSIIYQAVTKGLDASVPLVDSGVEWLGEIPKGWKVKRIKDFGKVIGGFAFKSSDFRQEGALILKISNVSHLSLKWDDISYLPENYEIIYSDYVAPPNSLIFALTRPIIKAGIKTVKLLENESFLINQRVGFFKPSNKINNGFLIYVTQSSGFVAIFENKITSSTIQPNISTEQIESIKFFCPPISEQQAIATHLDQETQRLDQLKANLNQQINVLSDYKKSLIYECVTGKKRVINAA